MAKNNYIGKSLSVLKSVKEYSFIRKLIIAKLEGEVILRKEQEVEGEEPIVTASCQKEAELTRDAIIDFLTHDDLIFTIAELKASLELEELKTSAPLNAKVDTSVNTTVAPGIAIGPGATVAPGSGLGTGKGMVTEPLQMSKGGGKGASKHGGRLIATGHAYVGLNDPTPNSDTTDEENDFTKVRLYYDKIPKNIL